MYLEFVLFYHFLVTLYPLCLRASIKSSSGSSLNWFFRNLLLSPMLRFDNASCRSISMNVLKFMCYMCMWVLSDKFLLDRGLVGVDGSG